LTSQHHDEPPCNPEAAPRLTLTYQRRAAELPPKSEACARGNPATAHHAEEKVQRSMSRLCSMALAACYAALPAYPH
jgi:hypothetical protein